jgi:hypothetical protein
MVNGDIGEPCGSFLFSPAFKEGYMVDNGEQAVSVRWFALVGLFRRVCANEDRIPKYEYRTTLCAARDRESAEKTLLAECRSYATDGVEFLDEYEVFELDRPPGKEPVQVAYDMILSPSDPETFIRTHWSREKVDSCEAQGWTHVWYNHDGSHSACYNCRQIRAGRLWEQTSDHEPENT